MIRMFLCIIRHREYARIFKFQNFQASHARVVSELEEVEKAQNQTVLSLATKPRGAGNAPAGGAGSSNSMDVESSATANLESEIASRFEGFVASGTYVTVDIEGVPQEVTVGLYNTRQAMSQIFYPKPQHLSICMQALATIQGNPGPLTIYSLMRYENKISVLHFNIQKYVLAPDSGFLPSSFSLFHKTSIYIYTHILYICIYLFIYLTHHFTTGTLVMKQQSNPKTA